MPSAAEILQSAGLHYAAGILDATRQTAPIANALQAYEMMGTNYLTMAFIGLPTVNGFRNLDEGFIASRGTIGMGKVDAFYIHTGVKEPVASTDLWNHNHRNMIPSGDVDDWVTMQIKQTVKVEWKNIDKQIIKGTSNQVKGFIGLRDATSPALAANVLTLATSAPESDNYTKWALNVGGTTATTGSRIFLVSTKANGVSLRMGGPQGLSGFLNFGEVVTQYADETDPGDSITKTNKYYIADAEGYLGLAIFGSSEGTDRRFTQRVARCAFNITTDSGKTATEAVLDSLLDTVPPEEQDNLLFIMSRRSGRQVAASKAGNTQVNITVSEGNAARRTFTSTPDMPTHHRGIPIVYSDDIANDDAIVTPA